MKPPSSSLPPMHRSDRFLRLLVCVLSVTGLLLTGCTQKRKTSTESSQSPGTTFSETGVDTVQTDVPYVPTPQDVVERMLEIADVSEDDVVYDLGSGDGRFVITAAQKYGARGVGVEIDPERIREARANAQDAGVADQVEFRQGDLFQTDLSEATVVTLYLLPEVNLKLRPKLLTELDPGDHVVSHDFDMDEWQPDHVEDMNGNTIYHWIIPETVPDSLLQTQ